LVVEVGPPAESLTKEIAMTRNIAAIVGSVRKNSINSRVAKALGASFVSGDLQWLRKA